jgi:hypothetical protein
MSDAPVRTRPLPWFRHYHDELDDPEIQALPSELYKARMNLICLCARHSGILPDFDKIGFALRVSPKDAEAYLGQLVELGFFVEDGGGTYKPADWDVRRFESDVSTQRVRKHRVRQGQGNVSGNVSETFPETDQIRVDKRRTEEKTLGAPSAPEFILDGDGIDPVDPERRRLEAKFDEFWKAYPRRAGTAAKAEARNLFLQWCKGRWHKNQRLPPVEPDLIIRGARHYAEQMRKQGKEGTEYVARARTWLEQRRWENDQPQAGTASRPALAHGDVVRAEHGYVDNIGEVWLRCDTPEWSAWEQYLLRERKAGPPNVRGWFFASRWPPDHNNQAKAA